MERLGHPGGGVVGREPIDGGRGDGLGLEIPADGSAGLDRPLAASGRVGYAAI